MSQPLIFRTKRGDTLIEVLIAIAVFSLVAILSITAMNLGVTNAETSLELATARTELNAQAEALRFLHSSYISENTLPKYDDLTPDERYRGEKHQQYTEVWRAIIENAVAPENLTVQFPISSCEDIYDETNGPSLLQQNKAFVLNARNLLLGDPAITKDVSRIYISSSAPNNKLKFQATPLNPRIIYANATDEAQIEDNDSGNWTMGEGNINVEDRLYDRVLLVEGIWVIAVQSDASNRNVDGTPQYYDFYIGSCWYGPGSKNPTNLDTVIRLYNPGGARS